MRLKDADALKENFPLPCEEWEMHGQQTLWLAREIRETIDLMPTIEPEQQWIPCSERLPDKPNVYTVTDHEGRVVRYVYYDNESSREYWKRCAKAWMPLPKPWKGEKDD